MKMSMVLVVGTALGALLACSSGSTGGTFADGGTEGGGTSDGGSTTTVETKGLDTSCETAADCIAVFAGSACSPCMCANDVIAKAAQASYDARLQAARSACGPQPAIGCAADCAEVKFSCSPASKCVLGGSDAGADGG